MHSYKLSDKDFIKLHKVSVKPLLQGYIRQHLVYITVTYYASCVSLFARPANSKDNYNFLGIGYSSTLHLSLIHIYHLRRKDCRLCRKDGKKFVRTLR